MEDFMEKLSKHTSYAIRGFVLGILISIVFLFLISLIPGSMSESGILFFFGILFLAVVMACFGFLLGTIQELRKEINEKLDKIKGKTDKLK